MQIKDLIGDEVATKGHTRLNIGSKHDNKLEEHVATFIVPKILNYVANQALDISSWNHLTEIKLSDDTFHIPD